MVGLLVWLVIGGVVGWLASIVMRTDAQQGIFLNVIVGIVGAFIGGLLFGGSINNGAITPMTFLVRCWVRSSCWRSSTSSVAAPSARTEASNKKGPSAGAAPFSCPVI